MNYKTFMQKKIKMKKPRWVNARRGLKGNALTAFLLTAVQFYLS